MQLADKNPGHLVPMKGVLAFAERLRRQLDSPLPNQQASSFDQALENSRQFFPSFAAAVGSPQLYNLSPEERRDLKLKLLDDVKLLIARSSDEVSGCKVLEAAPLPNDPEECIQRLNEIMMEGFEKLKTINHTITLIGPARDVMTKIIENKRAMEDFDEDVYKSMPEEVAKNKKARKGV